MKLNFATPVQQEGMEALAHKALTRNRHCNTDATSPGEEAGGVTAVTKQFNKRLRRKPSNDGGVTAVTAVTAKKGLHRKKTSAEDEREAFEERAAILEYEAGFDREEAERLAKAWVEKPQPKPLTAKEEARIRAWLAHIGETDPKQREKVLEACTQDMKALAYFLKRAEEMPKPPAAFDDRRPCRECANLVREICMAARWGEIPGGGRYMPVPNLLRRCEGFKDR